MKNLNAIIYLTIAVLLFIVWSKSCNKEPAPPIKKEITVPEVRAKLEPQTPIYIKSPEKPARIKWKAGKTIEVENPVNLDLVEAFKAAKDSLEQFKLYIAAIQIRSFANTFNDSNLTLTIEGKVRGSLISLEPTYTIKRRSLEIPNEKVVFRLLLGAAIQNNLNFDDFRYNLNAGFQNRNGNIIRFGYARQYDNNYFMLGYDLNIFERKQ